TIYCNSDATLKCDRSLITGVTDEEVHFDNSTKTLTCLPRGESLMAIEFNSSRFESLKCNETEGWTTTKKTYGDHILSEKHNVADASSQLNIKCVE
ncbi:hypothetical protein PMAYCL1PPCAC_01306, partial [Pristionchus mayeri]